MRLIRHSERAFSLQDFLSADECAQLVELAEAGGFSAAGVRTTGGPKAMPLVRNNERVMVEAPGWVALLWQRLGQVALPAVGTQVAQGLPKDLRFYKYAPGQRFKMHKGGPWMESGLTSQLTLLVYLNDDFSGGTTDFREFAVAPRTGSALLFVHDTWHEGTAVTEGTKYVLRSDVLYG
ncbi:prolyl hydroxylase family protein [Acidovorax sp. LjRoot194]|uniref:prolyl hydroxylase family protein n=1 Tax=Acidovorax sp. LjRoot194 TaxID=3342280 RepID=UPI003ECDFF89